MPDFLDPKVDILPKAQQQIWSSLSPAPRLSFVLYGGTAIALHLGHRVSLDFDFFRTTPLDKGELETSFAFMRAARTIQEEQNTLVVTAGTPSGPVKLSFFGGLDIGRIGTPLQTTDSTLLIASLDDLLATKLKAILDRADAKDYRDIAAMLAAGVRLERALGGFAKMYRRDAALPLRALGFFKDGDLPSLPEKDKELLRAARDRVHEIPDVSVEYGSLAIPLRADKR